jgi:hypothetical protein
LGKFQGKLPLRTGGIKEALAVPKRLLGGRSGLWQGHIAGPQQWIGLALEKLGRYEESIEAFDTIDDVDFIARYDENV